MSDLKRIVRPELEKIIEEGIRAAQEREELEFVSQSMSELGAKVFRNKLSRYGKRESE